MFVSSEYSAVALASNTSVVSSGVCLRVCTGEDVGEFAAILEVPVKTLSELTVASVV